MVWALSRRGVQLLVVTIVLSLGFVWVGSWTTTTSYEFRDSFVDTVPGPVTGPLPVPVAIDANTFHVSWDAPVSDAVTSPITDYVVYAFTCDGDYTLQHAYTGSGQTSIDFGPATEARGRTLDPGISYKFTVRSYNRLGWDATTHDTATATPCSDSPIRSESDDESGTPAIVAKPVSKDWLGPLHLLSSLGPSTWTLVIDTSFVVERLVPGMPLFQTAPLGQGIRAEFTESGRLVAIFTRPGTFPAEIQLLEDVVPGRHYRIVLALDNSSMLQVNVGGQDTKALTIGKAWVSLTDIRSGYGYDTQRPEFEGRIDQFGVHFEINSPIVDGTTRLLGQMLLALLATTGVVVMARQLAERLLREPHPEGR